MKAFFRTYWPHVFGSVVAAVVGLPAAVASYRHGMTVIERSSDPGMAALLPMTTDGLLLASLVALWARRLTGRSVGWVPWAAFSVGLVAAIATNLAGARTYIETGTGWDVVEAVGWAVWPPVCLAVVLEIVAWMVVPAAPVQVGLTGGELAELEDVAGVSVLPAEDGEATHLYRFHGEDGALLYGGITWWLKARLAKHRRVQPWWSEVVRVSVTTYANRFDALVAEVEMIETEQPKYNQDKGAAQDAVSGYRASDHVPAVPVAHAGPVPIESVAGDGNAPADDSDLIERLRIWTVEDGGVVPSRERVRVKFGIGSGRADRVRTALIAAQTEEPDRAVESPVRPHVVRSEGSAS